MSREKRLISFSEENFKYLQEVQEKNDFKYLSEAVNLIIKDHEKNLNFTLEEKINIMAEIISEKTVNAMYKIAKGVNKNDRNIQILIELINGLFINENQMDIMSTEERMHEAYQTAQKTVNDRIEKQALKKHYRTYE
ncbi:hypothetical protein [Clostridium perfringens]|uniref:hypothetical protein n=1 Tax=Clostridium perfringens TaxID=1502 RepID=UPI0024BC78D6|nr:hypothetical protein [Clostridium perfringens]ELC8332910.1 hypothetical protein [Clostridium perfringens]